MNRSPREWALPIPFDRDDPQHAAWIEGALTEIGEGRWLAGRVSDVVAGAELDVLVNPAEQRIRLREPAPPPEKAPPLPPTPKRRFSRVSQWNRKYEDWVERGE